MNERLLKDFYNLLKNEIPTQAIAKQNYSLFNRYFKSFFLQRSPDPRIWKRDFEPDWNNYLIGLGLSPRTLRNIIANANRFMTFLASKRINEIPLIKFKPISNPKFKTLTSAWKDKNELFAPRMSSYLYYKCREQQRFGLRTRDECRRPH